VSPYGDFVTVEQRSWLGTQPNPIHPNFHPGCRSPNGRAAGASLYDSMPGVYTLAFQHHSIIGRRPYDCLTGGDGVPLAVDLEMDHRLIPR
jgi:hypothetical protein